MSIVDLIIKGGILMIPIALCSVFSLSVIVERLIRYRKAKGNVSKLTDKLGPLIIGNKVSEARLLCEESGGLILWFRMPALPKWLELRIWNPGLSIGSWKSM